MITRTILHALWAVVVFVFAVTVALGVLFMLGAAWVGDELRAAAPHDPMLRHGAASVFGMVLFVGTVTPALTVLPAAIAAIVGLEPNTANQRCVRALLKLKKYLPDL